MYAEDEARLIIEAAAGPDHLQQLLDRRCRGEPLETVVGFAEFGGVRVEVDAGVFVPRQRTAGLVDIAVRLLGTATPSDVVVDLGCGSGALLAALLNAVSCEAYAVDSSPAAVACARRNLARTGVAVLLGDLFRPLPARVRGRVSVVLANLPYVPSAGIALMPREARLYEPIEALDGGPDGLDPLRAALTAAGAWLAPTGSYLCELHTGQLEAAQRYAVGLGYSFDAAVEPDDSGALVTITRWS